MFWKTRKFKELSCEWTEKLRLSGFEDIEVEIREKRNLRQRASKAYARTSLIERQNKLDYYLLVGECLFSTEIIEPLEKLIMEKHAEGYTITEIEAHLKICGTSRERTAIRHTIRRYQKKWGLREWSLKEMRLKKIPT